MKMTKHAVIRQWHVPGQEISSMITAETLRNDTTERPDCVSPTAAFLMRLFDALS